MNEITEEKHWKRRFFTVMAGQTVSLIGSSAVQFALIWWISIGTASPIMLSFAALVAFLPQMVLSPFVGVWVDRLNRKTVMIAADLFMGVAALVFAVFFVNGEPAYWSVGAVLCVRAIGGVFHSPALQASVSCMVPQSELVSANGWSQFLQSGAFMLGPVLGAAMYAALPMWLILVTDFFGAVVAVAALAAVKIPKPTQTENKASGFMKEMKEGASYLVKDKKLLTLTLSSVICLIFIMPLSTYYPLMTSSYFSLSAWHGSLVEITYAVGMMAAAFLTGIFSIKKKLHAVHVGLIAFGAASLLSGFLPATVPAFWVFSALCFFMGAACNFYNIPFIAYLQETIPQNAQGRVFSLVNMLMSFGMPVGLILAGPISEKYGVPFWFSVSGVAVMVIMIASLITMLRIKDHINE